MDKVILHNAVQKLKELEDTCKTRTFALEQAISQFNSLLKTAKSLYPNRVDIQSLKEYWDHALVKEEEFSDSISRLNSALELTQHGSISETFAQIKLPKNSTEDIALDLQELEGAIHLGLYKSALLLSGSIAESLLLSRHPDKTEKGPGLKDLVDEARKQKLFSKDTLRLLDCLIDYRDIIHPRAEKRNNTFRNEARMDAAITALKLLCNELEDPTVRY